MGIQYLNGYIKKHAKYDSIQKVKFKDLANKVIVIDASIYLYRFLADNCLLENIYSMVSLMKYYKIIPVFVFDGTAPIEKRELLEKRSQDKTIAEKKYNKILNQFNTLKDGLEKMELQEHLQTLKRKFIRLKRKDIYTVKQLLTAFGVTYIDAIGEADELCARLVIKRQAYACLSEDMDLFLYGCPRVLRYLSLLNETMILYNLDKILADLELTLTEFKEICILSGTDYNYKREGNIGLYETLRYFKQYKQSYDKNPKNHADFYNWLDTTHNCIKNIYELYNILIMFQTDSTGMSGIKLSKSIQTMNMEEIKKIMEPVGFIFVDRDTI
jgi:flap endonuclease-1